MRSTFRILFFARWELEKENGMVSLSARVTIDGERVKFSLKAEVSAKLWDPKAGKAKGQTKEAVQLNRYLDSIKGQLIQRYHSLAETNGVLSTISDFAPFANFTRGVCKLILSGVQSLVVKPGISKYSLNVREISLLICAILYSLNFSQM